MNIDKLVEFYNNNRDTINIIAVTAVISSLVTWLFTKFIPGISSLISNVSDKLMQKVGGQLAFKHIQAKYLNWVVLYNQDLNLTGIIGVGQKPRLEQVFISLKVSKETAEDIEPSGAQEQSPPSRSPARLRTWFTLSLNLVSEYFSKFVPGKQNDSVSKKLLFQPNKNWRLEQVFSRDNFTDSFLIVVFIVLPLVILLIQSKAENLLSIFLYFLLSLPFIGGVSIYKNGKDLIILFSRIIPPLVLVIYKFIFLWRFQIFPVNLVIGLLAGFLLYLLAEKDKFFTKKSKGDQSANEIGALLSNSNNIAILGKPGSGKSTYAQFIALTFAQEKAGNKKYRRGGIVKRRFAINEWYMPIMIPLRKVSKFINPNTIHSPKNLCIEAFKQDVLPANVREMFSDSFIQYMLDKGRCVLLLDGLDEVSNEEHFRLIVNEIKGLVSQYPKNKFLITSRHAGWRGGVGSAFQLTEVKDLSDDQISTFAYSWYESIELNRQNENSAMDDDEKRFRKNRAESKAKQLVEAIDEHESIRNLARNPLLLSMICYVHYNKSLPKERLSLYEDCSRLLLEQWDVEKGLPQDDIPLKYAQKEKIMQEIAFVMHSGKANNGVGVREVTAEAIISIIANIISDFGLSSSQAESLFKKLTERTGLIIPTEQYKKLYGFSHLTFQEFYTAKYLSKNRINIFAEIDSSTTESQENLSGWWREVIILQSGMIKDISEIIESLCCNTKLDYLGKRWQIAAQCLADSTEVPDEKSESLLLGELLRIRSLGRFNLENRKINSLAKKYLLTFTSDWQFHRYKLKTQGAEISTQEDALMFAAELIKQTTSSDTNIVFAAIDSMLMVGKKFDISKLITKDVASDLICKVGADTKFADVLELVDRHLPDREVRDAISEFFLKPMLDDFSEYYTGSLWNDQGFCRALMTISQNSLISDNVETRKIIISTLSKVFSSLPSYRKKNAAFRWSLRKFLSCSMRFMISVSDNQEDAGFVKSQLLAMLKQGTTNQLSWAILLLGELFRSDKTVFPVLVNQLCSPNASVRLSAISAIRKLDLGEDEINIVKDIYLGALAKTNGIQKVFFRVLEVLLGKGMLGTSQAEKVQVAGSLAIMNTTLTLENLLACDGYLSIYEDRYEWADLLIDVNWRLNDTDAKKIAEELVAIACDPEKSVSFISEIYSRTEKIHNELRHQMINHLYVDAHKGALAFLSTLNPVVGLESKEFLKLREELINENWDDANGAFEILESNNLLSQALFEV